MNIEYQLCHSLDWVGGALPSGFSGGMRRINACKKSSTCGQTLVARDFHRLFMAEALPAPTDHRARLHDDSPTAPLPRRATPKICGFDTAASAAWPYVDRWTTAAQGKSFSRLRCPIGGERPWPHANGITRSITKFDSLVNSAYPKSARKNVIIRCARRVHQGGIRTLEITQQVVRIREAIAVPIKSNFAEQPEKETMKAGSPGEGAIVGSIRSIVAPEGLGAWPSPITASRRKETRHEDSGNRPRQIQKCSVRL